MVGVFVGLCNRLGSNGVDGLDSGAVGCVFAGPFGFGAYASDIVALPTMFYTWMVTVIPVSATALATLASVRIQLIAILMVALGWFVYSNNKSRTRIRARE